MIERIDNNNYLHTAKLLLRLSEPIIKAGSNSRLKSTMPVEAASGAKEDRERFSHLEAVGRLLCGMAPLFELHQNASKWIQISDVHLMLDNISDPSSPDYLNFFEAMQPLVDAAFLSQAFLRAPKALWWALDDRVQQNLLNALKGTRSICPSFNNWLLFSAIIEVFFFKVGARYDGMRIDYALRQHEQWYVGDGHYKDGPDFHSDYYNSFVIQPMLLDILINMRGECSEWDRLYDKVLVRAQRYAEVLERLIGPDGSFPPIGRSLAYRCGSFHLLAQLSLLKLLPPSLKPAQVRCALWAVIEKTLGATNTFDPDGWLTIGLCGHQPAIAERYISTGSLYLCSTAFLPLGLPDSDQYWNEPDLPWTQKSLWTLTSNLMPDKAL